MTGLRNAYSISEATLGKMPIITNSAIPSPNVPDANANRLFFIFLTQSYKCHKSKTKKEYTKCILLQVRIFFDLRQLKYRMVFFHLFTQSQCIPIGHIVK